MKLALPRSVGSLLLAAGLLAPLAAAAAGPPQKPGASQTTLSAGQLCLPAIISAESTARLPSRLLEAIALVESGRVDKRTGRRVPWPWTINAEGEGYFFDSKAQAIAAVRELQARGVMSIDVGCMQVNLLHHPDAFPDLEQAFDPRTNARYAARFLSELYSRTPSWVQATAFYHSQTPELGDAYQRRVMVEWGGSPQAIPVYDSGFAAFSRSGFVDVVEGSAHYRAFAPASQKFAAFGRSR